MPFLSSAFTNSVALAKSAWSEGMMYPRGSRILGSCSTVLYSSVGSVRAPGTAPAGVSPPRGPLRAAAAAAATAAAARGCWLAAAAASSAAIRLGVTVQLSRLPFSMEFLPIW